MPLPWVRLDTNLPSHDKILALLTEFPKDGRATAFVYVCGIAYAGHNGTDGLIPFAALPLIHGTKRDADRLINDYGAGPLWHMAQRGWLMPNYLTRNEAAATTASKAAASTSAARKAACSRWHHPGCQCWREEKQA